jgi:hypothetical protein
MLSGMKRFRIQFLVLALACTTVPGTAIEAAQETPRATPNQQVRTMEIRKIRISAEGTVITATLDDNATSRDFVSLLPLTLTLKDYAATEKISDLPRKLSTAGAPAGSDPEVGDFSYYAPWGNLALFHKDFGYSVGLVKLGTIDAGVELLRRPGQLRVKVELINR